MDRQLARTPPRTLTAEGEQLHDSGSPPVRPKLAQDPRPRRRRCGARPGRQLSGRYHAHRPRGGHPAVPGQADHRVLDRERRYRRRERRRRQHRHPVVSAVRRPAVDPGRPGRHRHHQPGGAAAGRRPTPPRSRSRSPPTRPVGRASTRRPPAPAARRRSTSPAPAATCACTAPPGPPSTGYSLWEFQVYGAVGRRWLRYGQRGHRPAGHGVLHRERRYPGHGRGRRQRRHPLVQSAFADPQWIQVDLGAPVADLPGGAHLGNGVRHGVPAPDSPATAAPGRPSTRPPRAPAAPRRSPSPVPAATCGCTGPRGPPSTATRCGRLVVHTGPGVHQPQPVPAPVPAQCQPQRQPEPERPGGDVLLSYNKPAIASTYAGRRQLLELPAGQGVRPTDPTTRWATSATTGWVDPGWIYVDLGAAATVHSGDAAVGSGLRDGVPDPGLHRRDQLDDHLQHHHR